MSNEPPCKCHDSFATVLPVHDGHCCFRASDGTCHREEVAAWDAEFERRLTPSKAQQ